VICDALSKKTECYITNEDKKKEGARRAKKKKGASLSLSLSLSLSFSRGCFLGRARHAARLCIGNRRIHPLCHMALITMVIKRRVLVLVCDQAEVRTRDLRLVPHNVNPKM
jgi:hypothetical protein